MNDTAAAGPTTRRFTARDETRLRGVHPDLVAVMAEGLATSPVPFIITEGRRSRARQASLVAAGASHTLNSRHLTGHAVDIAAVVNGQVRWDWPLYPRIAEAVKAAARRRGVAIVWGGDWKSLRDGPHFELDRRRYP